MLAIITKPIPGKNSVLAAGVGFKPDILQVEYGRFLGKIHALTKNYEPGQPEWRRPHWHDPIFQEIGWLPESEWLVQQKYEELMAYLATLPKDHKGNPPLLEAARN